MNTNEICTSLEILNTLYATLSNNSNNKETLTSLTNQVKLITQVLDSNDTKFDFAEQCFQLYKVHYKGLMAIDENKYSRILLDKDELYKAFYPHIIEEAKSCLSYLSKQRQYDHLGRSTCRAFKLLEEVYETYKFNLGDINVSKKWYLETSKEIYGQYIAYLITEGFENPKKADKIVAQIEQLAEKHHIDLTNMSVSKSLYQ